MDQPPLEQSPDQLPEHPAPIPGYGYGEYRSDHHNGLAKASFVLGILGFFAVTAVLGVVFGGVALAQTKRTGQRGRGFAVTGLSFGLAWIVLLGTLVVLA